MLAIVRRNRWLIALLLLLFGQAGVVRASAAPTCPRSHDATPEQVSAVASASTAGQIVAAVEVVSADHTHHPVTDIPSAHPATSGCGGTALPVANAGAEPPPSAAPSFPLVDAVLPRLPTHAFFRPPQLS